MRFNSPDSLSPFSVGGKNAYAYCGGDPVNRSDPNGKFAILSNVFSIFNVSAVVAVGTFAGSLYVEDETLGLILSGISGLAGGIALGSKLAPLRKARQPQMSGSVQPRGNTSITIQMNSLPQGNPSSPPAYNPPAPVDRGLNRFSQRPPAFRTEARNPNLPQHRLGERPNGSPVFEGPNGTPTTRPSGASERSAGRVQTSDGDGNHNRNRAPPSGEASTVNVPPCASSARRLIASPRPNPPVARSRLRSNR